MTRNPVVSARDQARRLVQIATVLWSSGFGWLLDALGLRACVSIQCRVICASGLRSCPHHVAMDRPLPERMRAILVRLGPTFVKAGQLLAMRPDYVPAAYAEAFRTLYDDVPAFPSHDAEQVITAELGRPPAEVFVEFETMPFAAASLCQVHRARLRDGTAVAVKVQRPGVAAQMESDLALLTRLARRLERRRADVRMYSPVVAVEELADWTRRELDFTHEGRTADALRHRLEDDPDVVLPRVHWDYTTSRVLTMDLVTGVPPGPADELREHGLDADRLLKVGSRAMFRQIFDVGLFHADPHPGNVLFLPGNKVAFLDFGMSGRIGRRERRRMALVMWALVKGDHDAAAEQLLHLCPRQPGADLRGFQVAISELVDQWYGQAAAEFSMAHLLLAELSAGARYGVRFPRDLMLLARALVVLESMALLIDPKVQLTALGATFLPELQRLVLPFPETLQAAWHEARLDWVGLALDLPESLPHWLVDREVPPVAPQQGQPRQRNRWGPVAVAGVVGALVAWFARARATA